MCIHNRLWLGLILAAAAILTFLQVPLTSAQGITLVAAEVSGALPAVDPTSALWQQATALEVPLSAQNVVKPMWLSSRVKSVVVRALHNGSRIAFLVEWTDSTKNDTLVRIQDFRDAVAMQFTVGKIQPFYCMGQQGTNVNIWHWKADWQADLNLRQDMETLYPNMYVDMYPFADDTVGTKAGPGTYLDPNYLPALAAGNAFAVPAHPSSVENLTAGGAGSLTAQPPAAQNVGGFGVWNEGRWRVIFSRDLVSRNEADVTLLPGRVYSIAFAAWDGSNGERNGQKSVTQWLSLQLKGGAVVAEPPVLASGAQPSAASKPFDFSGIAFVTVPMLGLAGLFIGGATLFLLAAIFTRFGQKRG